MPAKQPAVGCGAELGQVNMQVASQCGEARHGPDGALRAVFEFAGVAASARPGPAGPDCGGRAVQVQGSPPVTGGEVEVDTTV